MNLYSLVASEMSSALLKGEIIECLSGCWPNNTVNLGNWGGGDLSTPSPQFWGEILCHKILHIHPAQLCARSVSRFQAFSKYNVMFNMHM